ncbi:acyl-CoA dehydrogenase family protein [Pseudofrankia sp. BMG5.37]|uniref:acyl-CoA dehydrogenase family protein n=1 Tax=Pseudofrankia sp. BMG5.37 TaxID=3050035 RepID=UPI002895A9D4|nr:acyl-CoA dehydrogenase family protein [Pseudofrankia sp. BMG5.37]MDT3446318.1 acyl-CoA dehydrogenase family protein [Pseudofrankia sp. BMG5.37]
MSLQDSDVSIASFMEKFFAETCPQEVVGWAESHGLDIGLWSQVDELGLTLISIDEADRGSGGSLTHLVTMLQAAGRNAAPLPLADTHLAAWLLVQSGQNVPAGPATVVPGTPRDTLEYVDGRLRGAAYAVPWARDADTVVFVVPAESGRLRIARAKRTSLQIVPGTDLAGMSCDTVSADDLEVDASWWPGDPDAPAARGALLRAALMAGALSAIFEMTTKYCRVRVQFGRTIGSNQSVQQHLVNLAQAAATSAAAVDQAAMAAGTQGEIFASFAAKVVAGREASLGARAAHQAHGAIGLTKEYRLQQLTRRLHTWRMEYGTEEALAQRIGASVVQHRSLMTFVGRRQGTTEFSTPTSGMRGRV